MTKEKDPKEITDQDLDDVAGGRRSMEGGSAGGGSTGGVGDADMKNISGGRGGSDIKVKIQDADLEG